MCLIHDDSFYIDLSHPRCQFWSWVFLSSTMPVLKLGVSLIHDASFEVGCFSHPWCQVLRPCLIDDANFWSRCLSHPLYPCYSRYIIHAAHCFVYFSSTRPVFWTVMWRDGAQTFGARNLAFRTERERQRQRRDEVEGLWRSREGLLERHRHRRLS